MVEVTAGQVLQIVDLEGQQVGDLMAYRPSDPDEYLSPAHTLSCLVKLMPGVGDELFSNLRTPLMRITRDDVGTHDMIVPCCDQRAVRARLRAAGPPVVPGLAGDGARATSAPSSRPPASRPGTSS